jgi:hypothetical protein
LLASLKEALKAALESVANATEEELLAHFLSALTSWQRRTGVQRKGNSETSQSQRSSRRARSVESQGSGDEDFLGMENISTLRKLHQLCVWLRSSAN